MGTADRLLAKVLNVAYPSRCPLCWSASDSFRLAPLCMRCFGAIERYEGPRCAICGEVMLSEYAGLWCGPCMKRKRHRMDGTLWYGLYDMALREAVHGLKFSGRRRLAEPLAALLSSLDIPGDIDGVVPVPPGRARLRERGFSHTHLLARAMGRARGLPVLPDALRKTRETPPQVGLKKKDREGNLRGAFAATRPLPGARIVLLDDVITTGATVRECALALRRAGARRVWVVAVAKTAFL